MKKLMTGLLIWYVLMSLASFAVYARDKSAAIRKRQRTPERTLHGLALAGGWPGALLAQYSLRHKSSKPGFLFIFWMTVMLNVLATAWLINGSPE